MSNFKKRNLISELKQKPKENNMKELNELKNVNFIEMARLIDNNFAGNKKIIVHPMKLGIVKVTGHTDGGQCINCEVKFDVYMNKLNGVFTQNESETAGAFRNVYPSTLKRVIDYLRANNFQYNQNK